MAEKNNLSKFSFIKSSSLRNDFVIFDYRDKYFELSTKQIQKISERKNIGCDQLIVIKKSLESTFLNPKTSKFETIDCEMEIYNCDGSVSGACGNATRCVAGLIFAENNNKKNIWIKTSKAILECKKISDELISVNMGKITFFDNFFIDQYTFYCADIGNPHAVCFMNEAINDEKFYQLGPQIENHNHFPHKTNVEFAQILSDNLIAVRVWERGVGETMACGSGACAVVAVAIKNNLINSNCVVVKFLGGNLTIEFNDNEVVMTGSYKNLFAGQIHEDLFF